MCLMERRKFTNNCFCDVAKGVFVTVAKMLCFPPSGCKRGLQVFHSLVCCQLHERRHEFQNEKRKICDAVEPAVISSLICNGREWEACWCRSALVWKRWTLATVPCSRLTQECGGDGGPWQHSVGSAPSGIFRRWNTRTFRSLSSLRCSGQRPPCSHPLAPPPQSSTQEACARCVAAAKQQPVKSRFVYLDRLIVFSPGFSSRLRRDSRLLIGSRG